MSRVAIIGSCITRDLWPFLGKDPGDLLYVARTSLPSLFAKGFEGLDLADAPPPPLNRHPHNCLVADLTKTALAALVRHRPTHIIFDFIDERFDLLATDQSLATYSWELEVSGYLGQSPLSQGRRIDRLSVGCDLLWRQALEELAAFLALTPLGDAQIILHRAQWAGRYRAANGKLSPLAESVEVLPGRLASRSAHNALLARYEAAFIAKFPQAKVIGAKDKQLVADETHRWGLSPFHYVPAYYQEVCRQLEPLLA